MPDIPIELDLLPGQQTYLHQDPETKGFF